jgi:hypothetical protein
MKITRSGARAHHGYTTIDLSDYEVEWDEDTRSLKLLSGNIGDFSTDARHDYELTLTLRDVNRIIDAAAEAATGVGRDEVLTELSGSLRSMLRIVVTSVGLGGPTEGTSSE